MVTPPKKATEATDISAAIASDATEAVVFHFCNNQVAGHVAPRKFSRIRFRLRIPAAINFCLARS
jgi:hypothetical protein